MWSRFPWWGRTVRRYAQGSQLGVGDFDAGGNALFTPRKRLAIKQRANLDGTYRWYGSYRLPDHLGGGTLLVRADTNSADDEAKINRSENFRLIPPDDPDYDEL